MKITPITVKKKLLYSVGVLCAGLTSCDDTPMQTLASRQRVPGDVPNDNPPAQPEKLPQQLGGSVPCIPDSQETKNEQETDMPEEMPQMLSGDVPVENLYGSGA